MTAVIVPVLTTEVRAKAGHTRHPPTSDALDLWSRSVRARCRCGRPIAPDRFSDCQGHGQGEPADRDTGAKLSRRQTMLASRQPKSEIQVGR
jgi:hypothetical protein